MKKGDCFVFEGLWLGILLRLCWDFVHEAFQCLYRHNTESLQRHDGATVWSADNMKSGRSPNIADPDFVGSCPVPFMFYQTTFEN
jgi:hypothetical protein